jgi:hemolysin activation/secretion protein
MKTFNRILGVVVVLALISTSALVALAQDQYQDQYQDQNQDQYPDQAQVQNQAPPAPNGQAPQGSQENDPPSRAARLQFMSGSVSVQPHGTDEWAAGALNRPLTNSDNIWADKDSRAEINVGSGLIQSIPRAA